MKKIVLCALMCVTLGLATAGCAKASDTQTDVNEEIEQGQETAEVTAEATETPAEEAEATPTETENQDSSLVTSSDGKYQATLPPNWEVPEENLDENMKMEFHGPSEDQYVGILVIDKATVGGMDIAAYMDSYAQGATTEFDNPTLGEKEPLEINGRPAYYMLITAKLDNVNFVNWVYAIDAGEEFYVATASAYSLNSEGTEVALNEIVYSFGPATQEVQDTQE